MGSYTKWVDGRIHDPNAGWKGRGLWAAISTRAPFHMEGGKGHTSKAIRFQPRPDPLARCAEATITHQVLKRNFKSNGSDLQVPPECPNEVGEHHHTAAENRPLRTQRARDYSGDDGAYWSKTDVHEHISRHHPSSQLVGDDGLQNPVG